VNALFLIASRLTFKPGLYVTFALFSLVFALVMVAVAVSISGAVENSLYSIIGNMTFFVSITFFWNLWANSIGDGLWDYLGITGAANWTTVLFLKLLNPSQAYKTIMNSMLGEGGNAERSARFSMFSGANGSEQATICNDVLAGEANTTQTIFGGPRPRVWRPPSRSRCTSPTAPRCSPPPVDRAGRRRQLHLQPVRPLIGRLNLVFFSWPSFSTATFFIVGFPLSLRSLREPLLEKRR